jgi:hypothetical protein
VRVGRRVMNQVGGGGEGKECGSVEGEVATRGLTEGGVVFLACGERERKREGVGS